MEFGNRRLAEPQQQGMIFFMNIDLAALSDIEVRQTAVVRVQMCEQHIAPGRVGTQFVQALLQRLQAGLAAESRIDQEIRVFSFNKITVQFLQRVARQGHTDAVNIFAEFFDHEYSSSPLCT